MHDILMINTSDGNGGAERTVKDLMFTCMENGHNITLAVGKKYSNLPNVVLVDNKKYRNPIAFMQSIIGYVQGHENYNFPGTQHILDRRSPDLIHCHNLHGGYFDLSELIKMNKRAPIMLTLQDAWLLAGHCAHAIGCDKWKHDCTSCPNLAIYQAITKDAAAFNLKKKADIFKKCKFYVAAPSQWMLDKAKQSILSPAIIESKVIMNGVDLDIFKPGDKKNARFVISQGNELQHTELSTPKIILCAANGLEHNPWKDFETLKTALGIVNNNLLLDKRIIVIALGGDSKRKEVIQGVAVYFMPFESDQYKVAAFYQAADVYVHAAHADTCPLTVIEAMACGTPVVASDVGGIPELVVNCNTGFLTAHADPKHMAHCIHDILSNDELQERMSKASVEVAKAQFDIKKQTKMYLDWYDKILNK
jgi:glycosyltransferase involved in cell wall biosynthesis